MEMIKRLEPLWLVLVILGGLTWAIVALFDTNIVASVFGDGVLTDVVYVLFGVAALMFVPRLLEDMRLGDRVHARGA